MAKILGRVLVLVMFLVCGPAARAHGALREAVPAANAVLPAPPPAEIRLRFNEPLEAAFCTLQVSDAAGQPVTDAKAGTDAADATVLRLPLPALAPGVYTVHWSVVTRDGHRTKGQYGFRLK